MEQILSASLMLPIAAAMLQQSQETDLLPKKRKVERWLLIARVAFFIFAVGWAVLSIITANY